MNGGVCCFPRRARLSDSSAFAHVFARPVKSSDRYFTVLVRSNGLMHPRLGMAISRKVAKSAVARNRIKRIVRESFRHHQSQLGGMDWVVMGRAGIAQQKNAALFTSLQQHWQRLALSCAPS
ncbi:MAG: ribonuclease P protein component [Gammaproteobacteria bacterium]|nr:ribonuclease P protein component [Gammaproteobacteria bacterium]MCP5195755.1 ribonuclease P protein component [Gammaproteobacteria bacterium]